VRLGFALAVALAGTCVSHAAPVAAHDCTREAPFCDIVGTLVQKPEPQRVVSGVIGHHCFFSHDEPKDQRDDRTLERRIEVAFREVTRQSGFLESITVHFLGQAEQVTGGLAAFAKRLDWETYDSRKRSPGQSETYTVNKRVEFGDTSTKSLGSYTIKNQAAAAGAANVPEMPGRPPPGAPNRGGGTYVDCNQPHSFLLLVSPPSEPPCRRPPCH
jgi:hypothetical protein